MEAKRPIAILDRRGAIRWKQGLQSNTSTLKNHNRTPKSGFLVTFKRNKQAY